MRTDSRFGDGPALLFIPVFRHNPVGKETAGTC